MKNSDFKTTALEAVWIWNLNTQERGALKNDFLNHAIIKSIH